MDNFIVSAIKYRPSTFHSVVGQSSITTTLKNSIKDNHMAHAYLFCGPRGVGKTTCARIFAKTINCQNVSDDFEPCNECESCVAFNENRSYSIHELDAASNNSVDDIRNLNEQVRIPPQLGKYSVYIIDEVHMLSQGAFNAFLKTLEEPPAHAIFILATTEKHKIIPTILSRCQIFDFNRIRIDDTVKHLQYVAQQEGIQIGDEALNIIAQKADGAMRDALSFFDQIVSFSGKNISYENAIENLNVLDYEYFFQLIKSFLKNDISNSLIVFDKILSNGFDGHNFIGGLSNHLRDLLVSKDPITLQLLEVGESIVARYKEQASLCNVSFLYNALKICNECDINYKVSKNKRLLVELALFKLCNIIPNDKINSVVESKATISSPNSAASTKTEAGTEKKKSEPKQIVAEKESPEVKKTVNVPPPPPKSTSMPTGAFSIKNASKVAVKVEKVAVNKTSQETESQEATYADKNFSLEELKVSWEKYLTSIKIDKPRLYNTLLGQKLTLDNNFHTTIKVSNVLQKQALNEAKNLMLRFIKTDLNSSKFDFTITVAESTQTLIENLTDAEKYKNMSKKNPQLLELKNQLDLDLV